MLFAELLWCSVEPVTRQFTWRSGLSAPGEMMRRAAVTIALANRAAEPLTGPADQDFAGEGLTSRQQGGG
jgi:hypothetical protein